MALTGHPPSFFDGKGAMRVQMTTGRSWLDAEGRTVHVLPGEQCEVDNEEAKRLLESDQAVPVAVKPVERSEKRGPGRPRKNPIEVR